MSFKLRPDQAVFAGGSAMPIMHWTAAKQGVTFSDAAAARNATAIAPGTLVCSIRVIGTAGAYFRQGGSTIDATANLAESVWIHPNDGWVDILTTQHKYVSFIAAAAGTTTAQIVERASA